MFFSTYILSGSWNEQKIIYSHILITRWFYKFKKY